MFVYCFVIDNGFGSIRRISQDSSMTLLDVYKTSIETFLKAKMKECASSPKDMSMNHVLIFTTSTAGPHQLTYFNDGIAKATEILKGVTAAGCSDWDAALRATHAYLNLYRLFTMQDTVGQGLFVSMVQNVNVWLFSDRVPRLFYFLRAPPNSESRNLSSCNEEPWKAIDEAWIRFERRSDTFVHLMIYASPQLPVSHWEESFDDFQSEHALSRCKVSFYPCNSVLLFVNSLFMCTRDVSKMLHVELRIVDAHSQADALLACVKAHAATSGFWCFAESAEFVQRLAAKKSKLIPRTNFLTLFLKRAAFDFDVPANFPVDEYTVEDCEMPGNFAMVREFITQDAHQNSDDEEDGNENKAFATNTTRFYDVYVGVKAADRPFGILEVSDATCTLRLLPYNFRKLFGILSAYSALNVQNGAAEVLSEGMRAIESDFHAYLIDLPKSYLKPLKAALKYFGFALKFPPFVTEEYLETCLETRSLLSKGALEALEQIHIKIEAHRTQQQEIRLPQKELHLAASISEFVDACADGTDVNCKLDAYADAFESLIVDEYSETLHVRERTSQSVAKMGDFYKNIIEALKFRDPYDFDEASPEHSIRTLFYNPFKTRKNSKALGGAQAAAAARGITYADESSEDEFPAAEDGVVCQDLDEFHALTALTPEVAAVTTVLPGAAAGSPTREFLPTIDVPQSEAASFVAQNYEPLCSDTAPPVASKQYAPVCDINSLIRSIRNPGKKHTDFFKKHATAMILANALNASMRVTIMRELRRFKRWSLLQFLGGHFTTPADIQ